MSTHTATTTYRLIGNGTYWGATAATLLVCRAVLYSASKQRALKTTCWLCHNNNGVLCSSPTLFMPSAWLRKLYME